MSGGPLCARTNVAANWITVLANRSAGQALVNAPERYIIARLLLSSVYACVASSISNNLAMSKPVQESTIAGTRRDTVCASTLQSLHFLQPGPASHDELTERTYAPHDATRLDCLRSSAQDNDSKPDAQLSDTASKTELALKRKARSQSSTTPAAGIASRRPGSAALNAAATDPRTTGHCRPLAAVLLPPTSPGRYARFEEPSAPSCCLYLLHSRLLRFR